jgi:hypothetical protein
MSNSFWAALLLPFAYLAIWCLFIWPVSWAVNRFVKNPRIKEALLRQRWTSWSKSPKR